MDNVGLDTARPQPAPQPELVAAGLVGDDNALDLAPRLARFGAPTIQKFQQCFLVGLELLERLAFDPRNNRRDEPLRLAHLDHSDHCVILLEGGEGLARIKRLRHGVLRRLFEQRRRCHTLAACPIASSSLVQLRIAVWTGDTRDTRPKPEFDDLTESSRRRWEQRLEKSILI